MARAFPGVTEGLRYGRRAWSVGPKCFAWERAFSKADLARFGDEKPPGGPIFAVIVADLLEKEAALEANPRAFFTIPHFEGFPAILVQLDTVTKRLLGTALAEAHRAATLARSRKKPRK